MSEIEMKPVHGSSNVAAVGFDPEAKVLRVAFHNGSAYNYAGVGADEHAALMSAKSVGSHLNANIKGKFRHSKVDSA
jgi:hypothetical protein